MGVYIKDMKMPDNCDACKFSGWSNLHQTACCKIMEYEPCFSDFSSEYKTRISELCPLVEVSQPHGKLIDENNVITAIHERLRVLQGDKEFIKKHGDIDLLGVLPYISKLPIVIEEEDEQ